MKNGGVVPMRNSLQQILSALAICLSSISLPAQPGSEAPAFRNPDLPVERRVEDLISRLTLEEKIGQTMMGSPEIKRLGIPRYDWWNEALHGVARNGIATVFPQAIGLAATWNPELHQRIAAASSTAWCIHDLCPSGFIRS